jgi:hypothetical protein
MYGVLFGLFYFGSVLTTFMVARAAVCCAGETAWRSWTLNRSGGSLVESDSAEFSCRTRQQAWETHLLRARSPPARIQEHTQAAFCFGGQVSFEPGEQAEDVNFSFPNLSRGQSHQLYDHEKWLLTGRRVLTTKTLRWHWGGKEQKGRPQVQWQGAEGGQPWVRS